MLKVLNVLKIMGGGLRVDKDDKDRMQLLLTADGDDDDDNNFENDIFIPKVCMNWISKLKLTTKQWLGYDFVWYNALIKMSEWLDI